MDILVSQSDRSFLSKWIPANILGLPVLLLPSKLGFFIMLGLAVTSDGGGANSYFYAAMGMGLVALAFTGALIGLWLGFLQWLALRRRLPQSGSWIPATTLGAALGAPLGALLYALIFVVFVDRPDGSYFSFAYEYLAFGPALGLLIGVFQGSQLRKWVNDAKWWVIGWTVLITTGMLLAFINRITTMFFLPIHAIIQRLKVLFPDIDNFQVFFVFEILTSITALIAVSLFTGILLDRLLTSRKKQEVAESN